MNISYRTIPLLTIISGILLISCMAPHQDQTKPNIIIIYTDDQGYGDVSALNPNAKFRTPYIDKIATEGIIFSDGHSSDTVCTPSRYSLLTGRYSWRTHLKSGVLGAEGTCLIEKDRTTIATLLQKNGYTTAMIGKWHLQMDFAGQAGQNRDWSIPFVGGPIDHGFDYFFGIPASMNYGILTYLENDKVLDPPVLWTKKKSVSDPRSFRNNVRPHDYRMTPPYQKEPGQGNTWIEAAPSFNDELVLETFAKKAVAHINKVSKRDKPFFLYLPLTSPHLPHCTHPDFKGRSACGNYGDFMEETDYRVGQVLDALDANNIAENTLVIFSSDNGAETNYQYHRETYQHQSSLHFKGGKRDIYEGGHRVPFLMRWPAVIKAGSVSNMPVCQTDYLASIADIVGVQLTDNEGEDSYSLLQTMKGKEYNTNIRGPIIHHAASGRFAIRDGNWKLNMFRGSGGSLKPTFFEAQANEAPYELYNLKADPGESNNLYFEQSLIVQDLQQKITEIILNGRSTEGVTQDYVKSNWDQLTWIENLDLK